MKTRFGPALIIAAALVSFACNGDDPPTATTESVDSASTATAQPTEAAQATSPTSVVPVSTATDPAGPGSPTPASSDSTAGAGALTSLSPLEKVESFRYELAAEFGPSDSDDASQTSSVSLEGAYRAPDRLALKLAIASAQLPLEVESIRIGETLYTRFGEDSPWQTSDADEAGLFTSFLPIDNEFFESFELGPIEDLGEFTTEERNGVQVKHYSFTAEDLRRLAEDAGRDDLVDELLQADDVAVDLYLADPGDYLVGVEVSGVVETDLLGQLGGTATPGADQSVRFELRFDLSDIDDPGIVIEPPV
jgi:hypothetical protein